MRPPTEVDVGMAGKVRLGDLIGGKYRVDGVLGSGGMGTVLRCHHILLERPVALKILHGELVGVGDAARRFALEARATATLKSPHAVRILDTDRLPSGAPYIVMELLDGRDLATIVSEEGPLSVDRALRYLLQAVNAIAEAHGHGIIHRDLKPANMILTREGIVKVVDFGLAKAPRVDAAWATTARAEDDAASDRTGTHVLVGSPCYMSPEQLRSSRDVDARADIWGLGVTLYFLLTGTEPFMAPNLPILISIIDSQPTPRVAERRADVIPSVDALIAQCLRKNPDERYRTITAFQTALIHVLAEHQKQSVATTNADNATTLPPTRRFTPLPPTEDVDPITSPVGEAHPADGELPTAFHPGPEDELSDSFQTTIDVVRGVPGPAVAPFTPDDDEPAEENTEVDVFGADDPRKRNPR
jgi:serine/threonine-protein kinase